MPEIEPTAEQLAAFVEGALEGQELEEVVSFLASHPEHAELVADVMVQAGLEDAPGGEHLAHTAGREGLERGGSVSRRVSLVAAALVALVGGFALFQIPGFNLASLDSPDPSAAVVIRAAMDKTDVQALPEGWHVLTWPQNRSGSSPTDSSQPEAPIAPGLVFRMGTRSLHLETAMARQDAAAARAALLELLFYVEGYSELDGPRLLYREIRRHLETEGTVDWQALNRLNNEVTTRLGARLGGHDGSFALGRGLEVARLRALAASASGEPLPGASIELHAEIPDDVAQEMAGLLQRSDPAAQLAGLSQLQNRLASWSRDR